MSYSQCKFSHCWTRILSKISFDIPNILEILQFSVDLSIQFLKIVTFHQNFSSF